jgi:hypothetical protein
MLLAHLGLRAGEVIRLKLEDIDWFEGGLIVRAGKNHRGQSLPLTQEVGDALVPYLRDARPATLDQEIFRRWRRPFDPLRSCVTIPASSGLYGLADSQRKTTPGIVLLQGGFGINNQINLCNLLAEEGYLVVAPDLFARLDRRVDLVHSQDDVEKGDEFGLVSCAQQEPAEVLGN